MKNKDIIFRNTISLRGPSIWTYPPALEAWIDIGEFEDYPSNKLPGFAERLTAWLPSLIEHRCSYDERGGFLRRLEEGTWVGHVLEAGADIQQIVNERLTLLDARYAIETDQAERIYVHNHAVRSGPPELMARLARGEQVDPSEIYFRCFPRLECAAPRFAWVNERLFFGLGERQPSQVLMRFFELL